MYSFFKTINQIKTLSQTGQQQPAPMILRREIHAGRDREQIVIGNMSALFATLGSIVHHGKDDHKKLKVICPPHFLDIVDKRHLKNNKWGQSPLGLPKMPRDLHYSRYPEQRQNNNILTWGQMQELRRLSIDIMTDIYDIPIYPGRPSIARAASGAFIVYVDGIEQFRASSDVLFYEKFYEYGLNSNDDTRIMSQRDGVDKHFSQANVIDLYRYTEEEMAKINTIIILGNGESAVWIARDFPYHKIIVIAPPGGRLPENPMYDPVVSNRITLINKELSGDLNQGFSLESRGRHIVIHNRVTGEKFHGVAVDATGQYPLFPTKGIVPEEQRLLLDIPLTVFPKALPANSLYNSYLTWLHATDNLDNTFLDPQVFHNEVFPRVMLQLADEVEISLNSQFFDDIRSYYTRQDHPQEDREMFQMFEKIYEDTTPDVLKDTRKFKILLEQLDRRRLDIVAYIERELRQKSRLVDSETSQPKRKL